MLSRAHTFRTNAKIAWKHNARPAINNSLSTNSNFRPISYEMHFLSNEINIDANEFNGIETLIPISIQ